MLDSTKIRETAKNIVDMGMELTQQGQKEADHLDEKGYKDIMGMAAGFGHTCAFVIVLVTFAQACCKMMQDEDKADLVAHFCAQLWREITSLAFPIGVMCAKFFEDTMGLIDERIEARGDFAEMTAELTEAVKDDEEFSKALDDFKVGWIKMTKKDKED